MTDLGKGILGVLGQGREHAVTAMAMARIFGYNDDRIIREEIRQLIADGHPIASSVTGNPKGYFIAVTQGEVQEYANSLKARLIEDAIRRRDFLRACKTKIEPKQLELMKG